MTHITRSAWALLLVGAAAYAMAPYYDMIQAKVSGVKKQDNKEGIFSKLESSFSAIASSHEGNRLRCTGFISHDRETIYTYSNGVVTNALISEADNSLVYKRR